MHVKLNSKTLTCWLLGIILLTIGVLNLLLVHFVPGMVFILISLLYFPPVQEFFRQRSGLTIPFFIKIILALVLIWFTLGVSDLGDMLDKWGQGR